MSFIRAAFARVFLYVNYLTQRAKYNWHQSAGNRRIGLIPGQTPLVLVMFLIFGSLNTFAAGSFFAIVDNGASVLYGFSSIDSASRAVWDGNQAAFPANEHTRSEYYGPMYWEAWGVPRMSPPYEGWTDYWMGFLDIDLKTGAITGPRPYYCIGSLLSG